MKRRCPFIYESKVRNGDFFDVILMKTGKGLMTPTKKMNKRSASDMARDPPSSPLNVMTWKERDLKRLSVEIRPLNVFVEKQSLACCGVHALNNAFQKVVVTCKDMMDFAQDMTKLNTSLSVKDYYTPGSGNFNIAVIKHWLRVTYNYSLLWVFYGVPNNPTLGIPHNTYNEEVAGQICRRKMMGYKTFFVHSPGHYFVFKTLVGGDLVKLDSLHVPQVSRIKSDVELGDVVRACSVFVFVPYRDDQPHADIPSRAIVIPDDP